MVDHCGCDGKAQRLPNESQHLWPCLIMVRAFCSLETGVLLLPRFHLESDLKEYSWPLFLMRWEGGSKGEKTEQEVGRGQISGWLKRPFWGNSVWLEPHSLITILGPTWRRVLTVWALAIKSCLAFFELNSFAPRMNRNQFETSQCMCFLIDSSCLFGAIKKSSAATSHSHRVPPHCYK